mgnify:CR=1 FL=1
MVLTTFTFDQLNFDGEYAVLPENSVLYIDTGVGMKNPSPYYSKSSAAGETGAIGFNSNNYYSWGIDTNTKYTAHVTFNEVNAEAIATAFNADVIYDKSGKVKGLVGKSPQAKIELDELKPDDDDWTPGENCLF